MSDASQAQHRARSGLGVLVLGMVLALSSVSVASAGQYKATSRYEATSHSKQKAQVKSSVAARSVASAFVVDIQTGKWAKVSSRPSSLSDQNVQVPLLLAADPARATRT